MNFRKQCPYCGQHIQYDESYEDTVTKCPTCLHELYIPRHVVDIQVNTKPLHVFFSIAMAVCIMTLIVAGNLTFGQQFILFLTFLSALFLIFEKPAG